MKIFFHIINSILDLSKNKLEDPTIIDVLEKMPNLVMILVLFYNY